MYLFIPVESKGSLMTNDNFRNCAFGLLVVCAFIAVAPFAVVFTIMV